MSFRICRHPAIFMLMLLACGTASAAEPVTGFYVGTNVGLSRVHVDTGGISAAVVSVGPVASAATTAEEDAFGFKIFGGYRFHPNFAVEGGYFNLGKINFTSTTTGPAVTIAGNARNDAGYNLDLVGIAPLNDAFSLFGRLGVQTSKTTVTGAPTTIGNGFASNETATSYKAGLGMQYDFTRNVGVRGEWERYHVPGGHVLIGKQNVDLFSAGMVFRF